MQQPKHILVIRLSAMGDVAMVVPVLRALISQNPNLKITLLTRAFFKPIFRDIPNLEVFEADIREKHKGVLGLYALSKELKALNIDAVADIHNVLRSKILRSFLKGIPFVKIDKGRAEKKALTSGKIFQQLKTTHQRYADVFSELGFKTDLSHPEFPEPKPLSDKILNLLGEKSQKWIGIAPFAAYESKMYPLGLIEKVIERLSTKHKILLFGGSKNEAEQLEIIRNKHQNVINLAGKFSFEEELNIISNLDVMLSMDSANAHLAAMFGKKVITIWGVTHPFAGFYPFAQDINLAILPDHKKFPKIPTSIYGNTFPVDYKNVAATISTDDIINKVESII